MEGLWPKCRPVLGILLVLFLGEVALKLHGFSLPAWHEFLGEEQTITVLSGTPRAVRSDDWRVALPSILAQRNVSPSFPRVNSLVGEPSTKMLLIAAPIPIADPLIVFKPAAWGYFLSGDLGLAWHWGFCLFGLLGAVFVATMLFTREVWISVFTAVAVVWSPLFQFWSLNGAPIAIFALLVMVSACLLFTSTRVVPVAAYAALLAWSLGGFVLAMYPPYQVVLGYFALTGFLAYLWKYRHRLRPLVRVKVLAAGFALACVGGGLAYYFGEIREELAALLGTVYPGQRLSQGGTLSWFRIFNTNLWSFRSAAGVAAFGNVCEGAAFFMFFPVAFAIGLIHALRSRWRPEPAILAFGAFIVFLCAWCVLPFGSGFASISQMGRVPAERSIIALGIAGHFLLALLAAAKLPPLSKKLASGVALCFSAFLGVLAHQLREVAPGMSLGLMAAAVAVSGALAYLLATRPRVALGVIAGLGVLATLSFNPVVRGGSDFAAGTQLGRAVLEIEKQAGPGRWLVFSDPYLPDFFRMLGVKAINGTHFYPMFGFWEKIDPEARFRDVYNRYAHIEFATAGEPGSNPEVTLLAPDLVRVAVHPDSPALARLNADFFVVSGDDSARFDASQYFERVAKVGLRSIYRWRSL